MTRLGAVNNVVEGSLEKLSAENQNPLMTPVIDRGLAAREGGADALPDAVQRHGRR